MSNKIVFPIFLACLILMNPGQLQAAPTGYDYDLDTRCLKSTTADAPNYFADQTECDGSGNWTIAVQSEKTLGQSCLGIANQSLPINTDLSPLTVSFLPHTNEFGNNNWQVKLTSDFSTKAHPCGPGLFTWYTLMDHVAHGGGPFARPNEIDTSIKLKLTEDHAHNANRAFIGWQGFWDGKSHGIELNVYLSPNWGDADPAPDIVTSVKNDSVEFVCMSGVPFGITLVPGVERTLYVRWPDILASLIARGYFTRPTNPWSQTATTAIYAGTEFNNFTASQAGQAELLISNFRNRNTTMDLNLDGRVDMTDWHIFAADFGKSDSTGSRRADADGNGTVDIYDYNELVSAYGR